MESRLSGNYFLLPDFLRISQLELLNIKAVNSDVYLSFCYLIKSYIHFRVKAEIV